MSESSIVQSSFSTFSTVTLSAGASGLPLLCSAASLHSLHVWHDVSQCYIYNCKLFSRYIVLTKCNISTQPFTVFSLTSCEFFYCMQSSPIIINFFYTMCMPPTQYIRNSKQPLLPRFNNFVYWQKYINRHLQPKWAQQPNTIGFHQFFCSFSYPLAAFTPLLLPA